MIAALSGWHEEHHAALAAVSDVDRLPAHVLLESASVLTRLPGGLAQPLSKVLDALQHSFPGRLLTLPEPEHRAFVRRLAAADLGGGALCDGGGNGPPPRHPAAHAGPAGASTYLAVGVEVVALDL